MPAHYRHDGVRIQHDPYAPGMAEKYGTPGNTDDDGFDPYADSVGAGIYGGTVKRRASDGGVVIGAQYQNHNSRPGPVYAGGGYTPVSAAIATFAAELQSGKAASEDATALAALLDAFPDLVNDVSTGGAVPLHTCGMSRANHAGDGVLDQARRGHRGARHVRVHASGPDGEQQPRRRARSARKRRRPQERARRRRGSAPRRETIGGDGCVTRAGRAGRAFFANRRGLELDRGHFLRVFCGTRPAVAGTYVAIEQVESIPRKFADVCVENGWDVADTWARLNGGANGVWFAHEAGESVNPSYVYHNKQDGCWWIDGPDGLGVFKAPGPPHAPPGASIRWRALDGEEDQPTLAVYRGRREVF